MALTKIPGSYIKDGSITENEILEGSLADDDPRITNIQITDNSYTVLDDTAVDVGGGYIKITGTRFASGCQVIIDSTPVLSTAFVSATEVRAQVPARSAGTYIVYLINPDGGVAIRVNGLTYSASPSWVSGSSLSTYYVNDQISIQLSATGATTYSLSAGSSLPSGLTLSSSGLLSGSVTGLVADTTYTFSILAIDTENQDSPRTFSVTIYVGELYFKSNILLLSGDGTNNATNNTFVDSSANNLTITRNGNVTTGSFTPHSPAGWSVNFNGAGDYLSLSPTSESLKLGTGDMTIEAWIYMHAFSTGAGETYWPIFIRGGTFNTVSGNIQAYEFRYSPQSGNRLVFSHRPSSGGFTEGTHQYSKVSTVLNLSLNTWYHVAAVRSGNSLKIFLNGTDVSDASTGNYDWSTFDFSINVTRCEIGRMVGGGSDNVIWYTNGCISNLRIIKGSAIYTSNFTPPTQSLSPVTNTTLLTCQSNRFIDNSPNALSVTPNGDVKINNWSPFPPTASYDATTHGGSAYFDGTGDYLATPTSTNFNFSSGAPHTFELWVYPMALPASGNNCRLLRFGPNDTPTSFIAFNFGSTGGVSMGIPYTGTSLGTAAGTLRINEWSHFAMTLDGTSAAIYKNGTLVASGTITAPTSANNSCTIGYDTVGTVNFQYKGYVSGLRVTRGTSVYTGNFTAPTASPTSGANTTLLLNFNNSGIVDLSGHNNIETFGDAKISTSVKKYGTGSISLDGTGDYLAIKSKSHNLFGFGSGDFTVELWIYFNTLTNGGIIDWRNALSTAEPLLILNSNTIIWSVSAASRIISQTVSTGQWYHLAVCRSGTSTKMFLDGVQTGSTYTDSTNYPMTTDVIEVGRDSRAANYYVNAYIDDLRITRGVARYTTNFTPPDRGLSPK